MSLAEYYDRAAVAASQVVAGFDADTFRQVLGGQNVGVSFSEEAAASPEGRAALDMLVRLLARLYPCLDFRTGATSTRTQETLDRLINLAREVNPRIDIVRVVKSAAAADERGGGGQVGDQDDSAADATGAPPTQDRAGLTAEVGVAVGADAPAWPRSIYLGCHGWTGSISMAERLPVGESRLPFGAGVGACLAAAAVFRILLDASAPAPTHMTLSALAGVDPIAAPDLPEGGWALPGRAVLVGAGAVGESAAWALARSPLSGQLDIVDHERVDLGNMQRYVLTGLTELDTSKATLAAQHINTTQAAMGGSLTAVAHDTDWVGALCEAGHQWEVALASVDSAAVRRAVQAALPRWLANAWTQPGDLGVSDHDFAAGACLACLYLPAGATPNEDELVAAALGIPEFVVEVRTLLHTGAPPSQPMLDTIAGRLGVDPHKLTPFTARTLRDLYVEGICGGVVVPLSSGTIRADVHVPLAHQSTLAGVLLAARLARRCAGVVLGRTEVTRLDIRQGPPAMPTQPAGKDSRGICLCQDGDFVDIYRQLWNGAAWA